MLRNEAADPDLATLVQLVDSDDWEEALNDAAELAGRRPDLRDSVCEAFRRQWGERGERDVAEVWDRRAAKATAKTAAVKPAMRQTIIKPVSVAIGTPKPESLKERLNRIMARKAAEDLHAEAKTMASKPEPKPEPEDPKTQQQTKEQKVEPIVLVEDAPYDSARIFAEFRYSDNTLQHWQGQFYVFNGKCWEEMEQGTLRQELYKFLDRTTVRTKAGLERFQPDQTKVNKVADALAAYMNLANVKKLPAWIGDEAASVPPEELVAMQNGLLHLPMRRLLPHTPKYFNLSLLEFEYDLHAQCPKWQKFQNDIWGHDTEAAAAVQEMFGLCITDQTRFQKAFLFVGPGRSGKGTMGRVLRKLVGQDNYVGPRINTFVNQFGMQNWIGKKVAVFSDARLERASDTATELLLATTGEDVQEIDRKYLRPWTGKLNTRILVLTNEVPEFKDESAVLPTRFIVFKMTRSFYGKEDIHLTDKLLAELPGILNWALNGWDRLAKRGYLVQPGSGCESAWNKDPVFGVIGIQSGPRG
jgi:putative DNA primase/helicase